MSLKLKIFVVLSCILVHSVADAAKSENSDSHNVMLGAQGPREVHLGRFTVTEKFKPMQTLSKDFQYKPQPKDLHYSRTITRIVISDKYTNGNGGYATLKDGGPSTNFAVINFKSQRNHGFNFVIDIYGI